MLSATLNRYPASLRRSQLRKKAHLYSLISKDQGQLPQYLVTRASHYKLGSSRGQQLEWGLEDEQMALCQDGPAPGAGIDEGRELASQLLAPTCWATASLLVWSGM